jgi:HEAT repeat protein
MLTECPKCGEELRPGMVRCRECGENLQAAGGAAPPARPPEPKQAAAVAPSAGGAGDVEPGNCPHCGAEVRAGMKRCRECSKLVSDTVVRTTPVSGVDSPDRPATTAAPSPKKAPLIKAPVAKAPVANESPSAVRRSAPMPTQPEPSPTGGVRETRAPVANGAKLAGTTEVAANATPRTGTPLNRPTPTRGNTRFNGRVADRKSDASSVENRRGAAGDSSGKSPVSDSAVPAASETPVVSKKPLTTYQYRKYSKTLATKGLDKPRLADERRQALEELVEFGDARVPELVRSALADDWVVVRETASRVLASFPGTESETALIERLRTDDSLDVRRAAGMSLATIGTGAAVMPLLQTALETPQCRLWTLEALARMGSRAVQSLLKTLQSSDPGLRLDAVIALGRIADATSAKPLLALLRDPSPTIRAHVAQALGNIGIVDYADSVAQLLDEDDPGVRLNAAQALSKLADERVRQDVVGLLQDPDPIIRGFGATAAARAGATSSWGAIAQLLGEEHEDVRARAAEALGVLGEPRAARILQTVLTDSSVKVRSNATVSLGQLNCPESVEGLALAANDLQPQVRKRAIDALAQIGTPEARDVIARILRSDHVPDVRQMAARLIAQFPSPETVELLKESLSDEFMVRVRACISLGEIGLPESADLLLPLLKDPVSEIRFHACNGLANIGDSRALKSLEEMLEETDPLVLRGVGKALTAFGDPRGEEALKRAGELSAGQAESKPTGKKSDKKPARAKSSGPRSNPLASVGALFSMLTPNALIGAISGLFTFPSASAGNFDPQTLAKPAGIAGGVLAVLAAVYFMFFASSEADLSLALMQRGDYLAAGFVGSDKVLATLSGGNREIYSATDRSLISSQPEQPKILALFTSPDEKTVLAIIEGESAFKVLDAATLSETGTLVGHAVQPSAGLFNADGSKFVSWDGQGGVIVWTIASKTAAAQLKFNVPGISVIGANSDGTIAAVGTNDGRVIVKQIDGKDVANMMPHTKPVTLIAFAPNGERMISGAAGTMHFWNMATRKREKTMTDTVFGQLATIRFLKDGKRAFVTGGRSGILDLEANTGKPVLSELASGLEFCALSPDEKLVVVGNARDLNLELFEAETGTKLGEIVP